MRGLCLGGAAALIMLPFCASAVGAAEPPRKIVATPQQMLNLADFLAQHGKMDEAEKLFGLLAHDRDPQIRNEARFRHAKLLLGMKRHRDAAILLRQVLDENPQAVPARLEMAQALQQLGETDAALRELRAIRSASLPPAVARLVDRFSAALRARRPSGASLEITIAPDSNINRATRSDTIGTVLGDFQIADDGKAKSGLGLSLNGQMFRRFAIGSDANILLRASAFANLYRHGRFNDLAADFAAGPEFAFDRDRVQLELGATQRWFGQKPYLRSARVAGTLSHSLGSRTLLRVSGSAALIDNQMNDLQDGKSYWGQFQVERALTPTTGVAASLALDRQALKDPGYATRGWRVGLIGWRDLGRATFTVTADLGRLHADKRLLLFPDRRQDRYSRLSFAASFRQLQYSGFAPLVRFSIERNRSSIAFYDYRRTRSEIGFVRAY